MVFVVYAVVLAILSILAGIGFVAAARRRAALRQFARRFGLEYSPTDPFGLIDHRFAVFNQADRARCDNVMWGNWHGVDVKVGELRFERDPDRTKLDLLKTTRRYSFAVVDLDAWVPRIAIRHDPLATLSETLLLDRLRFESDAFNRMYRVDCEDPRFAYKFIDARMMLWLQEIGESFPFDFEANGERALVSCRRLKPFGLVPLFGAAKGFVDHVPRVVLRDDAVSTPERPPG